MRVVQWNTHHGGIGTDGKLDTDRFAQALKTLNPDVVSLNEVESISQVREIINSLGPDWNHHSVYRNGHVATGNGQLNTLLYRGKESFKDQKELYSNRSVAYISLDGVSVYSTHVDNEKPTTRNVQLTQQLCWHKEQADPRIICGDFNAQSTSTELAPWFVWYKDAWAEAKKIGKSKGSGNTRNSRIDYIFYRGLEIESAEVIGNTTESDHHPLIVVFK